MSPSDLELQYDQDSTVLPNLQRKYYHVSFTFLISFVDGTYKVTVVLLKYDNTKVTRSFLFNSITCNSPQAEMINLEKQ
jgi:hypothetical protein